MSAAGDCGRSRERLRFLCRRQPAIARNARNIIPPTVDPTIVGIGTWPLGEGVDTMVVAADGDGGEVCSELCVEVELTCTEEVIEAEVRAGRVKVPPCVRQ